MLFLQSIQEFFVSLKNAAAISLRAIYDFINLFPTRSGMTISIHFTPKEKIFALDYYQKAANS
ncbi:hypothetical protein DB44_BP00090 [Candidatus Protochlamydia amoebophila]|uniref:Uncharacterized protein n=1 Tax=Candidatus Protochlamydia amoebophila TaxID=362787 RepID=A0A0C1HEB5_9BACT|nr:hypothetical protein DB44_BP00090 [Candidatus Protochlamydia amoebophila]